MNGNPLLTLLWLASLVHVGIESVRLKRVGRPVWHILLVGLAAWPLGYLLWLFYWPGCLLRRSAEEKAGEAWVEQLHLRRRTRKRAA